MGLRRGNREATPGIGQLSWVDSSLAGRRRRRRDVLAEIEQLADWAPFARLPAPIHCAAKGEAAYPLLMMFKVVSPQRLPLPPDALLQCRAKRGRLRDGLNRLNVKRWHTLAAPRVCLQAGKTWLLPRKLALTARRYHRRTPDY